ncbi:SymE family type I addiction module toxin [Pedobacter metabolipauper]|uniref:SymE family type I addiction module toxin n=1 Tax=Pedobacter metabolipauper TaxID=425513 RepID=UPI00106021A4|nr:SymE family type I addiction module toxin [Pedobacter metabolipauper]
MQHLKLQNTISTHKIEAVQTRIPTKHCTCGSCDLPKPKLPIGTRRIKIQPKYIAGAKGGKLVPVIRLQGAWLRKTGFECDSYVIISKKKGQLIIQMDNPR